MPGLDELKVSLTKNGYFKVAEVLKAFPRDQVLKNLNGTYNGIKLAPSQIANMLSADASGELPEVWDEVRALGDQAVEALTFISIIFSHTHLINLFKNAYTSEMRGVIVRDPADEKTYTDLVDSMERLGLCTKVKGATTTPYNLQPLFTNLKIGPLAKQILTLKLQKTGWKEPAADDPFTRDFYDQSFYYEFHKVFGMSREQFRDWLEGNTVEVTMPPDITVPDVEVTVSAPLIAALATKPFVIMSGPTGTGKTTTIRQLAQELQPEGVDEKFNYAFVPVEAGWTDGRHLLGYRNPFGRSGENYVSTELIRLLLRANFPKYADIPFFLILDEMNLSYVEMYFSRFLSLMEAKQGGKPEAILTPDDLVLLLGSGLSSPIEASYVEAAIAAGGLFLSSNVFIVGTVNVDETTHMFSPKVLDRAFIIETSTLAPSKTGASFQIASEEAATGKIAAINAFLLAGSSFTPDTSRNAALDDLHEKLGRFKFGPRVTLEAQRYIAATSALRNTSTYGITCHKDFTEAKPMLDRIVLQKMLPKMNGNRKQIGTTLQGLQKYLKDEGCTNSEAKVAQMISELQHLGFTNYFAQ